MTNSAMVFPGMGPTDYGELAKFVMINPSARALFAEADAAAGFRILPAFRDAEGDYSLPAQLAFLVGSLALAQWADRQDPSPRLLAAGPSFGAKPLCAYVGSLSVADTVAMTVGLAELGERYFAEHHQGLVTASFARVSKASLQPLLDRLTADGHWHEMACYVDEEFLMLTLAEDNLAAFQADIRSLGGFPLYAMRPPMHASIFGDLRQAALDDVLAPLTFTDPTIPVVHDSTGEILRTGEQIRDLVLSTYTSPVRWPRVVETLQQHDITDVVVAGSDALFSRVPCTVRNFTVLAASPRRALRPAA
ncbi:[acyl-carrier-protein] S-malonyltransferase [Nakamurella sp. UYEF19]|uniref:ACP S-malonyltransferase n=1 Tax=Nakamurella sp. UYEF19 TaxID=1756392 RepID=UPI003394EE7A